MENQAYTHKIAYMITAYTEPLSLKNLVTSLDNNDVDFYIHIDRKFSMGEFKDAMCESQNVCFLNDDERVKVYWGGGIHRFLCNTI